MREFIINIKNVYGYLGIGSLIFIENIFPPIPSEIVLLFGGFMTTYSDMNPWMVILWATIGAYAGACVLYGVGSILTRERLLKLVTSKVGQMLHLRAEHIELAEGWFEKKGYSTVFICRCIPIVRSLISVPAGMAKMPFLLFSVLTVAGSTLWNTILVWGGKISGSAWDSWLKYIGWYTKVAAVVIVLVAAGVVLYLKKKGKKVETDYDIQK